MQLNHSTITTLVYTYMHNTTWRLLDDQAQMKKAEQISTVICKKALNIPEPNESVDTFKSRWFTLMELEKGDRKTRVFRVYGIGGGYLVGEVRWAAGSELRSYCFFPTAGCFFDSKGLSDIQELITLLMAEREQLRNGQNKAA